MDCMNARMLLMFARPGRTEIAPEEEASLRQHLHQCAECRTFAGNERQLDDAIARSIRQVPVPDGLHDRILTQLARERRPRPWTYVAVAASLLLALGLGLGWYAHRTILEPAAFAANHRPLSSPATVLSWFREQGLDAETPPDFDFDYLDSWEIASIANRRVPKLLFLNRGAAAHVYVVARNTFRVEENFAEELAANSVHAEVQQYEDIPDFLFLIIYSAGSRDSFPRRGV